MNARNGDGKSDSPVANWTVCTCNTCSGRLEFEESNAGATVQCPHCGMDTVLFVPQAPLNSAQEPQKPLPQPPSSSTVIPEAARAPSPPNMVQPSTTEPSNAPKPPPALPPSTTQDIAKAVAFIAAVLTAGVAKFAGVIQFVAWMICFGVLLIGGLLFLDALHNANGAPQEAAAGAVFSTFFIGAYIFARLVEKICRLIVRK